MIWSICLGVRDLFWDCDDWRIQILYHWLRDLKRPQMSINVRKVHLMALGYFRGRLMCGSRALLFVSVMS